MISSSHGNERNDKTTYSSHHRKNSLLLTYKYTFFKFQFANPNSTSLLSLSLLSSLLIVWVCLDELIDRDLLFPILFSFQFRLIGEGIHFRLLGFSIMRPMESIQDLIEEAKVRTVFWALCIFGVTYFLTHTSKSMMMNIPIAILLVSAIRIFFNEVDFRWKVRPVPLQSYLSRLKDRQVSVNDSRLSNRPPPMKWKRKVGSPMVEAAINDLIDKILKDFVIDLWYSDITPDREFPEHIRGIIFEAIGEISVRTKDLNLMDLLTRDIVDLIGDHIDVFRRNQAIIGRDVMGTLSSEERDERLKYHLIASKELHPALVSAESEYKVLQQLIGGVIAIILKPREAQCPVVRSIARELVTCLVMQPVMNFASPEYINEVIELIFLALKDDSSNFFGGSQSTDVASQHVPSINIRNFQDSDNSSRKFSSSNNQEADRSLDKSYHHKATSLDSNLVLDELNQPKTADWARVLEAASQRRTEILMPENLENMWSKGRNYKKKEAKRIKAAIRGTTPSSPNSPLTTGKLGQELLLTGPGDSVKSNERALIQVTPGSVVDSPLDHGIDSSNRIEKSFPMEGHNKDILEDGTKTGAEGNRNRLKRSNSTSALKVQPEMKKALTEDCGSSIITEFYSPDFGSHGEEHRTRSASNIVLRSEGPHTPKLKCRVMGAYFEKLGSKSFAVYSIAVTDSEQRTWFVKRRYSNFERLHRHLKDIPNYTLHLPPKRIFSSSTEDAFVHQRCIQLDKYLQDLLSIANVAEQHEVWDFLSASSECYSFGNSSSVMRTLAVNVDDAVDDIVRQFKGVSNGLMRKVVGSTPSSEPSSSTLERHMSWNADEIDRHVPRQNTAETSSSISDNEEGERDRNHGLKEEDLSPQANRWHSDNELNSKEFPTQVVKLGEKYKTLTSEEKSLNFDWIKHGGYPSANIPSTSSSWADPYGMPPEWTPPNVCVPMLNLVDKIFQLNRRGWLRRQVFWMSKQILQLVMEDAIDDWLLRQIQWLRSEDTVAKGIRWVQDILWPGGTFFIKLGSAMGQEDDDQPSKTMLQRAGQFGGGRSGVNKQGSFESQLEAARRASHVKKMLLNGAPTTLVSLIGHKQYKRCARDIYYFLQSTVCVKQLAYGILELLLISVFPELRDLVVDIHKKMRGQQAL